MQLGLCQPTEHRTAARRALARTFSIIQGDVASGGHGSLSSGTARYLAG
jgi:hypothetical protein